MDAQGGGAWSSERSVTCPDRLPCLPACPPRTVVALGARSRTAAGLSLNSFEWVYEYVSEIPQISLFGGANKPYPASSHHHLALGAAPLPPLPLLWELLRQPEHEAAHTQRKAFSNNIRLSLLPVWLFPTDKPS